MLWLSLNNRDAPSMHCTLAVFFLMIAQEIREFVLVTIVATMARDGVPGMIQSLIAVTIPVVGMTANAAEIAQTGMTMTKTLA